METEISTFIREAFNVAPQNDQQHFFMHAIIQASLINIKISASRLWT